MTTDDSRFTSLEVPRSSLSSTTRPSYCGSMVTAYSSRRSSRSSHSSSSSSSSSHYWRHTRRLPLAPPRPPHRRRSRASTRCRGRRISRRLRPRPLPMAPPRVPYASVLPRPGARRLLPRTRRLPSAARPRQPSASAAPLAAHYASATAGCAIPSACLASGLVLREPPVASAPGSLSEGKRARRPLRPPPSCLPPSTPAPSPPPPSTPARCGLDLMRRGRQLRALTLAAQLSWALRVAKVVMSSKKQTRRNGAHVAWHGVVLAMLLHAGGQHRVWWLAAAGSKVARSGNRVWVGRPASDGGVVVRYSGWSTGDGARDASIAVGHE